MQVLWVLVVAAPVVECFLLAAGAGVMYGLQDAVTRGAIVFTHHHRLIAFVTTMWPWVLLGSATAGVLLTQASFRAERLEWALPLQPLPTRSPGS